METLLSALLWAAPWRDRKSLPQQRLRPETCRQGYQPEPAPEIFAPASPNLKLRGTFGRPMVLVALFRHYRPARPNNSAAKPFAACELEEDFPPGFLLQSREVGFRGSWPLVPGSCIHQRKDLHARMSEFPPPRC